MTLQLVISVVKMDNIMIIIYYHLLLFTRMDAIKKKMEKLANETNEAEMRFSPPLYFFSRSFQKQISFLFDIGLLTSKTSRPPMNWRFFSTNNNDYLLLSSQSSSIIAYSEHQSTSTNQRLNFFFIQG